MDQYGRETNEVQAYVASRTVEVRSKDVDRITCVFRRSPALGEDGRLPDNARRSTEVSDYGVNDTTALEEKITAVVNAEFYLK